MGYPIALYTFDHNLAACSVGYVVRGIGVAFSFFSAMARALCGGLCGGLPLLGHPCGVIPLQGPDPWDQGMGSLEAFTPP